jgi:hypothetical protein
MVLQPNRACLDEIDKLALLIDAFIARLFLLEPLYSMIARFFLLEPLYSMIARFFLLEPLYSMFPNTDI